MNCSLGFPKASFRPKTAPAAIHPKARIRNTEKLSSTCAFVASQSPHETTPQETSEALAASAACRCHIKCPAKECSGKEDAYSQPETDESPGRKLGATQRKNMEASKKTIVNRMPITVLVRSINRRYSQKWFLYLPEP